MEPGACEWPVPVRMKVRRPADDLLPTNICLLIKNCQPGVRGSSGNCSFYLLHPCSVLKDTHKIFLVLDLSLEERQFYYSAVYWELLVGILVISAFLPHEANDDS